ncbi:MAG: M20/M25/M40 family metallo-hydrolase, partial [Planctomycetales bacterium]|nr:M20/M25/M40 family metallo-hydrolase [Planctomycetales bacterium]
HRGPRRLLMAHMDTVPVCVGSQPVRKKNIVRSADPRTGLGADDRAGVAVTLHTALRLVREQVPHPPLTFLWTVQEEIGLHGARNVRKSMLGNPKLAFNWDGGAANKMTIGATGGYRLQIEIRGKASHAGNAPEQGISAIAIASLAIADLVHHGWHGDIHQGNQHGTSNIGVIQGGSATNVVTDQVFIRAEARSHDPQFRRKIVSEIEAAFARAVGEIRSSTGETGRVTCQGRLDYESFRLADHEPAVVAAATAIRAAGADPFPAITNGGVDANWMCVHGIPTVTLGCGQMHPHMVMEQLDLAQFQIACDVAWRLATDSQ